MQTGERSRCQARVLANPGITHSWKALYDKVANNSGFIVYGQNLWACTNWDQNIGAAFEKD
jgi:hypothetical protein